MARQKQTLILQKNISKNLRIIPRKKIKKVRRKAGGSRKIEYPVRKSMEMKKLMRKLKKSKSLKIACLTLLILKT